MSTKVKCFVVFIEGKTDERIVGVKALIQALPEIKEVRQVLICPNGFYSEKEIIIRREIKKPRDVEMGDWKRLIKKYGKGPYKSVLNLNTWTRDLYFEVGDKKVVKKMKGEIVVEKVLI